MHSQTLEDIASPDSQSALGLLKRSAVLLVTLLLLLEGGYFLLTGLLEIINFGWRQPMFDQYKMYPHYLEFAFPENLIQLENGHRPLLPNLITFIEIRCLNANQFLQITIGASCAFLMAVIPALAAWHQRSISMPMRSAIVATAMIGIFWLGNARMLLHGAELLHVYLPGLLVLLAALCTHRASHDSPVRWMISATIFCAGAMFCFGAGVAAFPAIALVAWLSRVPIRAIAMLAIGLLISLFFYLWVLPGDDSVRQMLHLRPIDSIATAARWIGSPWVNAWLGFANPPLYPWMSAAAQKTLVEVVVSTSANGIQNLFGIELRRTGSLILGLAGFLTLGIVVIKRLRHRGQVNAIDNVALIMALFGAAISVLIGVGRLENLTTQPDQIFADRYLPWSCIFWIGVAILLLLRLDRARPWIRATTIIAMFLLPPMLLSSHNEWAGWGEAVYKNSQASAAAAMSDVFDPQIFPNDDSALHEDVAHTLDLFRQHHLAMYAGQEYALLGKPVAEEASEKSATAIVVSIKTLQDTFNGKQAATFDAVVTHEVRWVGKQGPMIVLDQNDRVRGFVMPSFINGKPSNARLNMPRKRGYTGYINNYQANEEYRLALLDPELHSASVLVAIPPAK